MGRLDQEGGHSCPACSGGWTFLSASKRTGKNACTPILKKNHLLLPTDYYLFCRRRGYVPFLSALVGAEFGPDRQVLGYFPGLLHGEIELAY